MKTRALSFLFVVLLGSGIACSQSKSPIDSGTAAPATYEIDNSGDFDPNGTPPPTEVVNVELGEPMSLFYDGGRGFSNALPNEIGTGTAVDILFPCHAFNGPANSVQYSPSIAVASCPTGDGTLAYTTLTANFTYSELPGLNIADFPVESFDPSEAAWTNHSWAVGPDGTIGVLVVLQSNERVQAGVPGTTSTTYAGFATIRVGEPNWTISSLDEVDVSSVNENASSYVLYAVLPHDVFQIGGLSRNNNGGLSALDRTGKILWEWAPPTFHQIGRFSAIVGHPRPGNWIDGFLDSTTGTYDPLGVSYEDYDELIAFEEHSVSSTQVLLYDNPGVFGVMFDTGFVRLPESTRLHAGDENTWRAHVGCDEDPIGNIRSGRIDDCNGSSRTYITPSGIPFTWDRPLVGIAGGSALFAEENGSYFIIGPDGTETKRDVTDLSSGQILTSTPGELAFTMSDEYLLVFYPSDPNWSSYVIRIN